MSLLLMIIIPAVIYLSMIYATIKLAGYMKGKQVRTPKRYGSSYSLEYTPEAKQSRERWEAIAIISPAWPFMAIAAFFYGGYKLISNGIQYAYNASQRQSAEVAKRQESAAIQKEYESLLALENPGYEHKSLIASLEHLGAAPGRVAQKQLSS